MTRIMFWIAFTVILLFQLFPPMSATAQLGEASLKVKDSLNIPVELNTNRSIDVTLNISNDLARLPVDYVIAQSPSHGRAVATHDGQKPVITYVPMINYTGPDSFTIKAVAHNTTSNKPIPSNVGTISVIVNPNNSKLLVVAPPEIRAGLGFGLSLIVVFIIFLAVYLIIRAKRIRQQMGLDTRFWDIIRDDNWYPSLAIFQFLLWTGIVLFAYFGISLTRLFSGVGVFLDVPYTLILVMGISASVPVIGTAVSDIKYAGTTPVGVAPTKEVPSYQIRKKLPGFKTMLMENDKLSLTRFQMFAWTWIGIMAYLGLLFLVVSKLGSFESLVLPALPILFVSLMGLSQVTYLIAKSVRPSFVSINEVRPRRIRLEEVSNLTVLGSNFGNKGTVWIEYYQPLDDKEKARYCIPFQNLGDEEKQQYCRPLTRRDRTRMSTEDTEAYYNECAEIYEKECAEEHMYHHTRLREQYDVTPKTLEGWIDNRILISLENNVKEKLEHDKYIVRVEKNGLLTYANSDAEFEIIRDKAATDKAATDKAATDKAATDKAATDKAAGSRLER
jgi:hypothetical protein